MVLTVAYFERFGVELWVASGTGKISRFFPVHDIAKAVGSPLFKLLPGFDAFTLSDTVSAFAERGKKTAWSVWRVSEVTAALSGLSGNLDTISEQTRAAGKICHSFIWHNKSTYRH